MGVGEGVCVMRGVVWGDPAQAGTTKGAVPKNLQRH
jgi:hypothetical protein